MLQSNIEEDVFFSSFQPQKSLKLKDEMKKITMTRTHTGIEWVLSESSIANSKRECRPIESEIEKFFGILLFDAACVTSHKSDFFDKLSSRLIYDRKLKKKKKEEINDLMLLLVFMFFHSLR